MYAHAEKSFKSPFLEHIRHCQIIFVASWRILERAHSGDPRRGLPPKVKVAGNMAFIILSEQTA
jgi:hypothetical protein